jgi:hypothetical protein
MRYVPNRRTDKITALSDFPEMASQTSFTTEDNSALSPEARLRLLPSGGAHCQVERCVSGEVHFVNCRNFIHCEDQLGFGNACICTNPIRKAIYNEFGV